MRCLIVDDSADFRAVLSNMLERGGISVVAAASNTADAMTCCRDLHPDVALVDVELGEENGFDLAEALCGPGMAEPPVVILVSTYSEQDFAELIAVSPAAGFVPKFALSADAVLDLVVRATSPAARPISEPRGR